MLIHWYSPLWLHPFVPLNQHAICSSHPTPYTSRGVWTAVHASPWLLLTSPWGKAVLPQATILDAPPVAFCPMGRWFWWSGSFWCSRGREQLRVQEVCGRWTLGTGSAGDGEESSTIPQPSRCWGAIPMLVPASLPGWTPIWCVWIVLEHVKIWSLGSMVLFHGLLIEKLQERASLHSSSKGSDFQISDSTPSFCVW